MVNEHTRSRDENERKMPVNSFTWFRSAEFSFRHCHRRNFWERQFTCLSLRPMKTLTKHKPIDGMKPPQLSFGCIASLAAAQVSLFVLHPALDNVLNTDTHQFLDRLRFRGLHNTYLTVSTVQWAAGLLHVWFALAVWRRFDAGRSEAPVQAGGKNA